MKKKKIIVIILIIFLFVLVVPIKFQYFDGGTIEYRSLIYKIIKWHRIDDYYENGILNYNIEFSNADEIIKVPNISGIYYLQFYYKCLEGDVSYAFKINIS